MSADRHTLVGPYVLDALPPGEREEFEAHLAQCPECQAEAAELRETAAHLARSAALPPPPDLRQRVLAEAARTRQVPPRGRLAATATRRRWVAGLVAAAAVLVVVALGTVTVQAQRRADRAEQLTAIVADPGAHSVDLDGEEGTLRLVVSPDHGASVLVARGLPAPPEGKVYALWYQRDGHMVPAGLFHPDDDGAVRTRVDGIPTDVVGVTVEPDGGSDEPTLPIVAQGSL